MKTIQKKKKTIHTDDSEDSSEKMKITFWDRLKMLNIKRKFILVERGMEWVLFMGRWILSPMYLFLVLILGAILIKFVADGSTLLWNILSYDFHEMIIRILELLDLTLVGNLVLIIIMSGYENFVSQIEYTERHIDRPKWMDRLDYSGLKLKIISSVVAISVIELLQDFLYISPRTVNPEVEFWRIIIHIIFVFTGVAFAGMEVLSEKRHEIKDKDTLAEETTIGFKK